MSNRRSALYTLCLFEAFPSRGNEKYGEEKQRVIYFMYHSAVSPFGGERSEPITSMRIMPYDRESQSRNADFISIARRAIHNPQRRRRCRPLSEAMHSEHDLKERQRRTNHSESFPLWGATLLHNPRRQPRPFFYKICGEAATTTLGLKGRQT